MNGALNPSWHAPLFDRLAALHASRPISYHVPGHKYGQFLADMPGMPDAVLGVMQSVMHIDVTELSPTDDLYAPSGVIGEAQRLAAATFGADQSYFLVGGSTVGNLAMLLAVCEPDDLILVQRNAHKSVLNGLKLSGARAVFLMPGRDSDNGLDHIPPLEQVEQALQRYSEAKAVFLTNPSYYGLSVELEPYVELVHRHGKMLLVDEAHGAHYGLHPSFPKSAMQVGADAAVQSTHKTLQALTMGAMLHVQGERINRQSIMNALRMIQSSSPSYPIMASLDITRAMIDLRGSELFERGLAAASSFSAWINEQPHYRIADARAGNMQIDPLRVALCHSSGSMTGFQLQKRLEGSGIYAEMADSRYVVLLFGTATDTDDVVKLQQALVEIARDVGVQGSPNGRNAVQLFPDMRQGISEPVAFSRSGVSLQRGKHTERISLVEAAGRYASEAVIPYPPGIPLLYEGECITAEAISAIHRLVADGARCQGAADPTMETIEVIVER